jgi:type VI secretion system secreted protein VgrG
LGLVGPPSRQRLLEIPIPGSGTSNSSRLIAGRTFTLTGHASTELDGEYLLLEVTSHGSQPNVLGEEGESSGPSYGNSFTTIPAEVTYRPPRTTPRPTVQGPQFAVVVGPPGEEIYVDQHGRVKVQFTWDMEGSNDENSSCWIRVCQPWAGAGYGALFLPRIGQEVMVSFLGGDPNRPIITGVVHNGQNQPPCSLPAQKTVSTIKTTTNELRFDDVKGGEAVNLSAGRNLGFAVANDCSWSVENNLSMAVTGASQQKARTITIEAEESITLKVGGNQVEISAGKVEIKSGQITTTSEGLTEIKGSLIKLN